MGDLADNHSQSITNVVEEVAATVADHLLDGAAHDSVRWIQVYPPGQFPGPASESGVIEAVSFEAPYGRPRWRQHTQEELERFAGGAVRSWHSSDYTVPDMIRRGIPILHPETKHHRPNLKDQENGAARRSRVTLSPIEGAPPKKAPWWRCWREL
jgi:hypothetical protein